MTVYVTEKDKQKLERTLMDAEAEIAPILAKNGYRKVGSQLPTLDLRSKTDKEKIVLDIAKYVFQRGALRFSELYRNNGLTDKEVFHRRVMAPDTKEGEIGGDGVAAPRSFPRAVADITQGFHKLTKEAVREVNAVCKDLKLDVNDVMGRIEFSRLMKRVIEVPMMQAIEPVYVLQRLFRTLNLPGIIGNTIEIPLVAVSALEPSKVGEDGSVIEKQIDLVGGNITARFMKIGVAARVSEDFERFSTFDFFGAIIDAARRGMAREREFQAFDHLDSRGTTIIDNTGRFGFDGVVDSTTFASAGVDIEGAYNGGHTIEDVFTTMSEFVTNGQMPDTMVLSAAAWKIWAQDQTLRAWAFQHGIPQLYQTPDGRPGYAAEHDVLGGFLGNNPDFPRGSQQTTQMPQFINGLPLRIIVSPFMRFDTDPGGGTPIDFTDMMMLDAAAGVGYFVQNQDITISNWVDMEHDIRKMRMVERYAYGVLKNSKSIAHLRKLKTDVVTFDVRDRLVFSMQHTLTSAPNVGASKTAS
jgi:hypothetical protein